jgi:hypothetical protein
MNQQQADWVNLQRGDRTARDILSRIDRDALTPAEKIALAQAWTLAHIAAAFDTFRLR